MESTISRGEPRDREKAAQGSLFDHAEFSAKAHRDDFRNLLIWGDNKLAMASLLERFRGKIDLIYIDPPVDVGEKTGYAALLPGLCAARRLGRGRRVEGGRECIC